MKIKSIVITAFTAAFLFFATGCGTGPTVTLSVQAIDPLGGVLHYRWKTTDGSVKDVDAPTTTWTLPTGSGLHFAYVLISNGKGGYTERRIVVSTDSIGTPSFASVPRDFDAPAKAASNHISYRAVARGGYYGVTGNGVYLPDVPIYLHDDLTGNITSTVVTDLRGSYTVPDALPGALYSAYCAIESNGPFSLCFSPEEFITRSGEAVNDQYHNVTDSARKDYVGRVVLADGQPCGMDSEFFNAKSTARVTLLDAADQVLAGPYRANVFGHYGFTANPNAHSIKIECEAATPVKIAVPADWSVTPRTVISDSTSPVINAMSATLQGKEVGIFLPPPSGVPSDNVADRDFFLTFKGIDSKLGACQYYVAIGAVKSCDSTGKPAGGISFNDWKRKVGMDPYAKGGQHDVTATFINRVDLNLTRRHHSIAYAPNKMAAYVCNHLGPTDETQDAANTAIDNAIQGKNLVACVAMDYGVTNGVNNNQPFTRFITFGPSGELLLSINLDGRAEKFMPGTCIACHGGDRYAGKFAEDGSGQADIGAHFLPYDAGNFVFSTAAGLTESDQQQSVYTLNQNVLNSSGANVATQELINGWYASGTTVLDKNYLPASWQGKPDKDLAFYTHVYARSCRTCHVAMNESLNFDHYGNVDDPTLYPSATNEDGRFRISVGSCPNGGGSAAFVRNFSMPNSLRTFNLFFGSAGSAVDQPAIVSAFVGNDPGVTCTLEPSPEP